LIAELRKAHVLPILIWLFAFPSLILSFALWERHDQNSAATAAVRAIDDRQATVLWSLTPRSAQGYRMKYDKVACVASGESRRIVRLRKGRPSQGGWFKGWSAVGIEPVEGSRPRYLQSC